MFNPEKMLGNLLMGGMRRKRGVGGLLSGGVALGLVGVAMEAAEHYLNSGKQAGSAAPANLPGGAPIPPPAPDRPAAPPPPPPAVGGGPTAPPPGPPPMSPETPSAENQAILLIRAMIAAANADGVIDGDERERILGRLDDAGFSSEEREFLEVELGRPRTAEQIAAEVADAASAREVYLASLLAVEVDTPQERNYLSSLAGLLGLDAAVVTELHRAAALPPDG